MTTESINAVKSKIKNLREWVTPARTTSAFLSKGVLTPEEFVKAGTEYIYIFLTTILLFIVYEVKGKTSFLL